MGNNNRFFSTYEEPQINLTPLIDVVFVILIMFIVIAPLLDTDRVELASHAKKEKTHPLNEKSPLQITVYADETIAINAQKISYDQLPRYFAYAKKKFPNALPQLFQDKNASFGSYQKVKNALEEAGFKELDLILKP